MNPPANNSNSNTVSKPSSSLNYPSQEDRYKKLLAQIDKEKSFSTSITTLNDNALVFNLIDPLNKNKVATFAIAYKPYTSPPEWKLWVNNNTSLDYKDWNEVLEIFEIPGIIKDVSSLKESFSSSIVEEFEAYNNLWK